jgi:hypothetical protein
VPLQKRESSLYCKKYFYVNYFSTFSVKVEEGDAENKLNLAKYFLPFGHNRQICIQCDQRRSGQKVIKIFLIIVAMMKRSHQFRPKVPATIHARLPKIRVPQEAYKFLGAMDGLIGQLPVEAPAHPLG